MPFKEIKNKVKILFAEDVPVHNIMAKEILRKEGLNFDFLLVDEKEAFRKALTEFKPDLVITDYMMPDFTGMEALLLSLAVNPDIPVIILTGSISEEVAVECMRSGATNYVIKENLVRLPFAVKEALQKKIALMEQRKAILALQESESRLQTITRSAGDAIIMIDNDGLISFWNPAAEKILGYNEEEAAGKNLHELIAPPEYQKDFHAHFDIFRHSGEGNAIGRILELEAIRKNGDRIHVSLNLSAVKIKELWHAVGIVSDITERKKFAEELLSAKIRAEASDRLKTAFINNISHEVRTPLNGILGFSELISQPGLPDQERSQYSSLIKKSSNRLLRTITSYMDISMIVSGTMQIQNKPFDLKESMHDLLDQFRPACQAKGLDLLLKVPVQELPIIVNSDAELLVKIISHLIDNAVKFTPVGVISFGYTMKPQGLEFFVKDTGIGISKELQPRIFEHFIQEETSFTRNYDGSVLGLSIAKGLVESLGGKIWVKSQIGSGSEFHFTLPHNETEAMMPGRVKKEKVEIITKEPVILVAEDDEPNYILIDILLKKEGITVIHATNGKEAVELCRKHPEISLVLMDMKMPELNGMDATYEIKSFRKDLPVIAITAYAMSGYERQEVGSGCDDYIAKPISKEKLLALLRKYF
ncbi:MAG: response regulator [Bacteroidetes bacterium]|nr:response regulator [Bacteroidota bacterium]